MIEAWPVGIVNYIPGYPPHYIQPRYIAEVMSTEQDSLNCEVVLCTGARFVVHVEPLKMRRLIHEDRSKP